MAFYKKILVLKQLAQTNSLSKTVSGIARLEVENGVSELFLTVINLTVVSGSEYKFLIVDGHKNFHFINGGSRPTSIHLTLPDGMDFEKGFALGVYLIKDDIPATIVFAREEGFNFSASDFKKAVAEKCLTDRKDAERISKSQPSEPNPTHPPYPPAPNPDPTITPPEEFPSPDKPAVKEQYDDEAVATENYFAIDQSIESKLCAVKEMTYANIRLEDATPYYRNQKEKEQGSCGAHCFQDETNSFERENRSQKQPYFATVKSELFALFEKFQHEHSLENLFHDSSFVRINYSDEKFYVVGLIKEKGVEKYICYGVPATYSKNPPKELKGYCTFIPLSIFNLTGEGFWMMFQDALSGDCVKP